VENEVATAAAVMAIHQLTVINNLTTTNQPSDQQGQQQDQQQQSCPDGSQPDDYAK
jgi:hypothetical protein